MYVLNDDGMYARKALNPSKKENTRLLFERLEKNEVELRENGYLIDMLPVSIQEDIKRMETFSTFDKKVCNLINSRRFDNKVECPKCGKINGTYSKATERIKFRDTFVNIGYRVCWNCDEDIFWFDSLAFGTRRGRLNTKDILKKREEYLKKDAKKREKKEKKRAYLKDYAMKIRTMALKKRDGVLKERDFVNMW